MYEGLEILSTGKPELEPWFKIVHCDVCKRFTSRPLYLGCATNHTFCGRCLLAHIKLIGKACPVCESPFVTPNRTIFQPHVYSLLGLMDVKAPAASQKLRASIQDNEATDDFVAALLASSYQPSLSSIEQ